GRDYAYLVYRLGKKVKFDYVGPAESSKVKKIKEKVIKRKEIESLLKKTKINLKEVQRVLRNRK
ncbi:hypothetical protein ACFLZV_04345, partial [Candidatus Margulisiibacteriota bacterium]